MEMDIDNISMVLIGKEEFDEILLEFKELKESQSNNIKISHVVKEAFEAVESRLIDNTFSPDEILTLIEGLEILISIVS